MKRTLRIIAICILFIGLGAGLFFTCRAEEARRGELMCRNLSISFADNYNFVTEDDIRYYMNQHFGNWDKIPSDSINLSKIEHMLDLQSAILKSQAYITGDGTLNIVITQREPVIRFQQGDHGFYVDDMGFVFPLQGNYISRVPVIDGEIPILTSDGYKGKIEGTKNQEWMDKVLGLVSFIEKHKQWSDNIVQISVSKNGDFILVPREGKELFIFGPPDEIEKKFSKIEKYYQYIKPLNKNYCSVNVKYKRQIICK